MNNTAMQELIDYAIEKFGSSNDKINDVICQAMILKENEKQNIIDSFNQGYREGETETMVANTNKDVSEYDDAINYYKNTFKP